MTKEDAIDKVKEYLKARKREYLTIVEDKIFEENKKIIYGKKKGEVVDFFVVPYEIEGYDHPIDHFVLIDKETGKVLFTITQHGYAEEWEDEYLE